MLPICESYRRLHENSDEANIQLSMQFIMQFVTDPNTTQDELELNDKLAMNIATAIDDGSTVELGYYGWEGDMDMEIFAEALSRLFRLGKLTFDVSETGTNLYIRQA
jgi:hypothetical protein